MVAGAERFVAALLGAGDYERTRTEGHRLPWPAARCAAEVGDELVARG